MHVHLARLTGTGALEDPFRPANADVLGEARARWGMVDLRPDPDWVDGWCLVGSELRADVAGAHYLGDSGDEVSAAVRRALENRLGVTLPVGLSVRRLVRELLLVHADDRPLGQRTRWGRLQPNRRRRAYRVCLGGRAWDEWPAISGGATIADDFDRADSDPPGDPWVEVVGTNFAISSNRLHFGGTTVGYGRHTTALDGVDTYAEADGEWDDTSTFTQWGVQVRMTTTANARGYMMFLERGSGGLPAERPNGFAIRSTSAANSRTTHASSTTDIYQTWHGRIEISGSDLDAYYTPAGQPQETLQVTNTLYSDGNYVGVYTSRPNYWDNFEAGDLGGGTVTGSATGAFGFSAPAQGTRSVAGQAAGSFGFAAPASGTASGQVSGAATGVFGFTAPATGSRTVLGAATGSFGFTGPAAGSASSGISVPFTEPWTGTNGAPWPSHWTTDGTTGAVVDIQGNQGRMLTGTIGGYGDYARALLDDLAAADFDLTVDLVVGAQEEKYSLLAWRTDRTFSASSATWPGNGYGVEVKVDSATPANGAWYVERADAGARTSLSGSQAYTAAAGDTIHLNVVCSGGDVEVRVWKNAESKPAAASYSFTDSAHTARTGHHLALQGGGGTLDEVAWDNFAVDFAAATGTATGVFGFEALAAGVVEHPGQATGEFGFTVPAAGLRAVEGAATGAFGFSGPSSGTITGAPVEGSATGAFGFAAPAQGTRVVTGTATGTFGFAAPAAGTHIVTGQADGSFGFSGPAAGLRTVTGTATGVFGFAAPAAGTVTITGAATGTFGFSGPASGLGTSPGSGAATGVFGFSAPAQGVVTRFGAAEGVFGFSGPATGVKIVAGQLVGSFGFAAPAVGLRVVTGTATGTFGFAAPAAGAVTGSAVEGAATGVFGFAGPAAGTVTVHGAALGAFGFAGPAAALRVVTGAATGTFGFAAPITLAVNIIDPASRTIAVWDLRSAGTIAVWDLRSAGTTASWDPASAATTLEVTT